MINIKIIGAGGIGTALIFPLARYLNYSGEKNIKLTIIDGDSFEAKNQDRQTFNDYGNKAEITARSIRQDFPQLDVESCNEYVTPSSIDYLIAENDIVFLCVDNHKTRKLVSDCCCDLKNVVLISGGNKLTDGNMQIHIRKGGKNITVPVANDLHPEIENPKDRRPDEISCDEQVESAPQIIFMNLTIAVLMLNAYYAYKNHTITYDEAYADIVSNSVRAVKRTT